MMIVWLRHRSMARRNCVAYSCETARRRTTARRISEGLE